MPVSTDRVTAAATAAAGSFSQWVSCFLECFADGKLKSQDVSSAFSDFMHRYKIWSLSERCGDTRGKTGVLCFRRNLLHGILQERVHQIGLYTVDY